MLTEDMLLFAKPNDSERIVLDYIFLVPFESLRTCWRCERLRERARARERQSSRTAQEPLL
jgi:hypothetical protein